MKTETTPRFNNAITKLYDAFHNGTLNAFHCKRCAVGSIVGGSKWTENWFTDTSGGFLRQKFRNKRPIFEVVATGYSIKELAQLELVFLNEFDLEAGKRNGNDKENQFKGLCAVVEYLCELDGIPNVMDYTCLFETENEKPKYELSF
jgi:hypothetical protein